VAAPAGTCREPDRPVAGLVPAMVGVPVVRAVGWLEEAGLSLVQRLRVDDAAARDGVGPVPGRRAARAAGTPVQLTVAVDAQGAGALGVTLVPEVLGQPEETARHLLDQAGLTPEVRTGCDTDAARAAASPAGSGAPGPPGEPGRPRQPGPPVGQPPRRAASRHDHHTGDADAPQRRRTVASRARSPRGVGGPGRGGPGRRWDGRSPGPARGGRRRRPPRPGPSR
jgi:hypothetical protein